MATDRSWLGTLWRRFGVTFKPRVDERPFLERAQTQSAGKLEVTLAVPDGAESHAFFGVPLSRRGLQPVWVRIRNGEDQPCRLSVLSLSASYYTPLEAAAACHYSTGAQILSFGVMALLFLPALLLLPVRMIRSAIANRRMDEHFQAHALSLRPIAPGGEASGFVFTPLDVGTKVLTPRISLPDDERGFTFSIPVPGLDADYLRRLEEAHPESTPVDCDVATIVRHLRDMPKATTNAKGTGTGDPVNLVVVGEFPTILSAFGARWDQTEAITFATCLKTARSFVSGAEYRYSPVSPLFLFGRSQDFALQLIRSSVNERLHLRLWKTPLRFRGKPVWVGQVSRDIGVRFTLKTWNLTTHRIDPDVDESRDYVVEDLVEAERAEAATYVGGVGACDRSAPRRNLTGDPYFTDGQRAAIVVSEGPTKARFIAWPPPVD